MLDDDSIIDKLVELKETSTNDWWDEISAAERESILKGVEEADAGNLNPHSTARALYEKAL